MPFSKTPANAWVEFTSGIKDSRFSDPLPMCGLCGNGGYIDTRNSARTPSGVSIGVFAFCICPNGRAIKRGRGKSKWGSNSVISTVGTLFDNDTCWKK